MTVCHYRHIVYITLGNNRLKNLFDFVKILSEELVNVNVLQENFDV